VVGGLSSGRGVVRELGPECPGAAGVGGELEGEGARLAAGAGLVAEPVGAGVAGGGADDLVVVAECGDAEVVPVSVQEDGGLVETGDVAECLVAEPVGDSGFAAADVPVGDAHARAVRGGDGERLFPFVGGHELDVLVSGAAFDCRADVVLYEEPPVVAGFPDPLSATDPFAELAVVGGDCDVGDVGGVGGERSEGFGHDGLGRADLGGEVEVVGLRLADRVVESLADVAGVDEEYLLVAVAGAVVGDLADDAVESAERVGCAAPAAGLADLEVGEDDGEGGRPGGRPGGFGGLLLEDGGEVLVGEPLRLLSFGGAGDVGDLLVGSVFEADGLPAACDGLGGDSEERVRLCVCLVVAAADGAPVTTDGGLGHAEPGAELHVGFALLLGQLVVGDNRLVERAHCSCLQSV